MSLSDYCKGLEGTVRDRYLAKISTVRNLDPYFLKTGFSSKVEDMPAITSNHIQDYLVNTVSTYTFRAFMAMKSMFAEDFVASDKVSKLECRRIGDKFIVRGNVAPSMRSSEPCRLAWAICCTAGLIEGAHCTCMAGLAEGCSHIGAILFGVMHLRDQSRLCSVTESPAYWKIPARRQDVAMASVRGIDFGTPKVIMKRKKKGIQIQPAKHSKIYPEPSDEEYSNALRTILEKGTVVCSHYVTSPFNEQFKTNNPDLPPSLLSLYDPEHETKSLEELRAIGRQVDISITPEKAKLVCLKTKDQAKCRQWYRQRAGKVPASLSQKLYVMNIDDPAISTIRSVVYPYQHRFTSKATKYGCEHEKLAFHDYLSKMKSEHQNFTCKDTGYTINPECPEFGATPDGDTKCTCCGHGCLEIKCPFCMEQFDGDEVQKALERNLAKHCLHQILCEQTGHFIYSLKRDHPYYFQVQQQIFVCNVKFCDFVLWTGKVFIRTRIYADNAFWSDVSTENKKKFYDVLMPEILGRYYTRLHAEKKRIAAEQNPQSKPKGVPKKKKPKAKPSYSTENNATPEFFRPGQQVTNTGPRQVLRTIQQPLHHGKVHNSTSSTPVTPNTPVKVVQIGKVTCSQSNLSHSTPVRVVQVITSTPPFSKKSNTFKIPVQPRSTFYQRLLNVPPSPK